MNDGTVFNGISDAALERAIALGGKATGKSAMMPPYGGALTPQEIADVVAYMRVIATPAYVKPTLWSRIAFRKKQRNAAAASDSSTPAAGN
jgi:mono/diheme cytochrome c family protein